jgi:glycosyltransferase involved in cell wall biosynthesis
MLIRRRPRRTGFPDAAMSRPTSRRCDGVSVVMIVRDAQRTLGRALASVAAFDDVVVYDTGSTDTTADIARGFPNVRYEAGVLQGFGPTRNIAAGLARHDWILPLDADEEVTPALLQGLCATPRDNPAAIHCFWRINLFLGRRLRGRIGREYIRRMYHRHRVEFAGNVHECLRSRDGQRNPEVPVGGELMHDSYASVGDLFHKRWRYADPALRGHLRAAHPVVASLRALWMFLRRYLVQGGVLNGWHGFVLASADAYGTFLKYVWNYAAQSRAAQARTHEPGYEEEGRS